MSGALEPARRALAGSPAWVVGGAVRDRRLGREHPDVDLVVGGSVQEAARAIAREARAAVFALSQEFGHWRVVARDHGWQLDLVPLHEEGIAADLARRDFTVNAIAEPLSDGDPVDPTGGLADLDARLLRMTSSRAFSDDPLRTLRLVRLAGDLGFTIEDDTLAAARAEVARLSDVAPERVFAELKRIVAGPDPLGGLALMEELGLNAVVLPELTALHGVEQTAYHHADVHDHTLEVLAQVIALERDPVRSVGEEHAAAVSAFLAEPLADGLTRAGALRFGALLHDIAKPETQVALPDGRFGFPQHDRVGELRSREILARLRASQRLRAHVGGLARHHLRLGFLVHEQPISRRALYGYLHRCDPVEVDVTLLSIADRLATRGRKAQESIAKHIALAREVLGEAFAWHAAGGSGEPLVRGDELARALEIHPGPALGELVAELAEAQWAGELTTKDEAIAYAARVLKGERAP